MATTAEVYTGSEATYEGWPGVPVRAPSQAIDTTLEVPVQSQCDCEEE